MSQWSRERIEQFAPDSASMKSAEGLAKASAWQSRGQRGQIIWGECFGSGAKPYQVRVALEDAGYRCTCPSRKQPCKHTLGLLLLYADVGAFPESAAPEFVVEWLANREKRAEAKATRASQPAVPPDPGAQARRQEKREMRIILGLDRLESWLADIIAQGLARARAQPPSFWSQMAARLVDAQAPGLANRVRELGTAALAGEQWPDRMLAAIARLQLLVDAYRRLDTLPAPLGAEVRTLVGWTQKQEELLAQAGVKDRWHVVAIRQGGDEMLRSQSTWLRGASSGQLALILEFAAGRQTLSTAFAHGQVLDTELVFFEGVSRYRALIKGSATVVGLTSAFPPASDIVSLQTLFAAALAVNPWLERWPGFLGPVVPTMDKDQCLLTDATGRQLPVSSSFRHGWALTALSGGAPLSVFGEWDGRHFEPISVAAESGLYSIAQIGWIRFLAKAG